MAKWKIAGQLAVAMREAERVAAEKRLLAEQQQESIKNGVLLRSLKRTRDQAGQRAKFGFISHERWFQSLKREAEDRRKDMKVAAGTVNQKQDEHNKKEVLNSVRTMDHHLHHVRKINAAIEMIRIKEKETEGEMNSVRRQLKAARKTRDRVCVAPPDKVAQRVEMAHHQLGLQLAENRRLADYIKHLEAQRDQVVIIYQQLKSDLEKLSKQLGSHIEEAQSTYEQRDMNIRNMLKLKEHMTKSASAYTNDMQLVQFKIDVMKRMERFMMTKNKQRQDEGRERRRDLRQQVSCTEKDLIGLRQLMGTIASDLQESDMHLIVTTFIQLEVENFMLFKNICHTRDTCHAMQGEIIDMKLRLEKLHAKNEKENQEIKARKLELCEKIDICKREADKKEQQVEEANKVIARYINGILKTLTKMKYTDQDIQHLAGVFKQIEERNIRVFLAELERYINRQDELFSTMQFLKWRRARKLSLGMGHYNPEPLPPRQQPNRRVVVVPPLPVELTVAAQEDSVFLPTPLIEEPPVKPLELHQMTFELQQEPGSGALRVESFCSANASSCQNSSSQLHADKASQRALTAGDRTPKALQVDKTSRKGLHAADETSQESLHAGEKAAHKALQAPGVFGQSLSFNPDIF